MSPDDVKGRIADEVDKRSAVLVDASHRIHDHPELCYEETFAHDLLTSILAGEGVDVTESAYGLETAFVARAGTEGPNIAVCCEYDALPEIGHGCGHNIIAAAGLGAGLAAAVLADELGGRITILGTPAEEGGGGKIKMIEKGAFTDVDAAMMVHPASADLTSMNTLAIHQMHVVYHGEAAHAAAAPHKGRNALDAAVLGYMNAAALRQHIRPEERIHGIFTRAGAKPNIVPAVTEAEWYARSGSLKTLAPLKERLVAALQGGADAAGCTMEYEWYNEPYADMRDNDPMLALYESNASRFGRTLRNARDDAGVVGSTDMGNVSYEVPSIHPMIKAAPDGMAIHTSQFADEAAGPQGDAAVLEGAKIMAMTIADLWLSPDAVTAAKHAFAADPRIHSAEEATA